MNITIEDANFLPHCACLINLSLEKNQLNLIRGVNGIGKSTLAALLKKDFFKDVTLIEQEPLTHFYNRELQELKRIFIKANPPYLEISTLEELWHLFELDKVSDRMVSHLSGGENQSLKLVFGLSLKNKIIILDEPSQYLDQSRRKKLSDVLDKWMKEHFVIVIEHESAWLADIPKSSVELFLDKSVLKARYV